MRILRSRDLDFVVLVNNSLATDFVGDKGTGQAMARPAKLEPGLFRCAKSDRPQYRASVVRYRLREAPQSSVETQRER